MEHARSHNAGSDRRPRIAYLVSHYPTVSHAFIEREVHALRTSGVEVHTFSVRPSSSKEQLSDNSRSEARTTVNLLGRPFIDYARSQARLVQRHPRAWLSALRGALTTGAAAPKARLWQVFYLVEAGLMLEELTRIGVRHVHVHFANNAADIARRVVQLGTFVEGAEAGWRWTLSMHGPTEFADPTGFDLAAKTASADAVACISEFCRSELLAPLAPERHPATAIVRMGVEVDRFPAMAAARQDRARMRATRILFVGRLVAEKGPDVLIASVALLKARGVALDVVLIGAGPLLLELQKATEEAGLDDCIRLLGAKGQDELPDWYAWADVFCLPSYSEGVPVVLMEAMSSELPVITTPIAGIPELVDESSGVLVSPGDPEMLAGAIEGLARDGALRTLLGRGGRRRVQAEFRPDMNAIRLLGLLGLHDSARNAKLGFSPRVGGGTAGAPLVGES